MNETEQSTKTLKEHPQTSATTNHNHDLLPSNNLSNIQTLNHIIVAENVYDLPMSSSIDMLPPPPQLPSSCEQAESLNENHQMEKFSDQTLLLNSNSENSNASNKTSLANRKSRSNSIGPHPPPPPVPPKPQFKRLNSIGSANESVNEGEKTIEEKIMAARKRSLELKTSNFSANGNSNGSNPMLINELSTILARQKKKIEDSMNNNNSSEIISNKSSSPTNESQTNKSVNDRLAGSPMLTKKPPPPPRSDRTHVSRRPSNDSRI